MEAVLEAIETARDPGANLDYEGSVPTEQASYETLFGDAGQPVRPLKQTPRYLKRLSEVARVVERTYRTGETGQLREAMMVADFPLLFGDIFDRQMVGKYSEMTPQWELYTKIVTLRDFRTVNRFATDGLEGALNAVGEQKQYPKAVLSEARHQLTLSKYGRMTSFSWEAMVNDDLEALMDAPERFAKAARRTEARAVTATHVGTAGPSSSLYTSGNGNIITANPALSIEGLQTAMTVLGGMLDADSEPILVEAMVLEVPPALAIVARNILNATAINAGGLGQVGGGGVAGQGLVANNWMRDMLTLVVNPYIPIICTSNDNTTWFLHAAKTSGRAPFEAGRLRGYETPQTFQKSPDQTRIGGGANLMDGDFDFDTIWYKLRHAFGATDTANTGGYKLTVASNGTGS